MLDLDHSFQHSVESEELMISACMLADTKHNRRYRLKEHISFLIDQGTYVVAANMENYIVYFSGRHNPELSKLLPRN